MLTVGSLFSGVGGIDLGLERAGMRVIWQSEIDPHASKVLAKLWPGVPNHGDIRTIDPARIERPDIICGGFPCQDISEAGKRKGIDEGERSGLWREYVRLVRHLRPALVLGENVRALKHRGYDRVFDDLAQIGYRCRAFVVGAIHVGASQQRLRTWILADTDDPRLQGAERSGEPTAPWAQREAACSEPLRSASGRWPPGPGAVIHVPRMVDGPTHRAHRLRAIGNAVVPQIPELFGLAIQSSGARSGALPKLRANCAKGIE